MNPRKLDQSALEEFLRWQDDPCLFIETVFKVEMDGWQKEASYAVRDGHSVSIRSGHGVGKSAWLSWIVIWWMVTKLGPRIACTAPTSHQLNDVLWGEIAKWTKFLPAALKKELEVKAERVEATRNPKELYCVARTARKEQPEAFQGFHADDMLFIVDEASGVEDIIFQVGEGAMSTKGAQTILVGNPTRTSGYFYDSHTSMAELWYTMKVSCEDAKMSDPSYAKKMAKQYGVDSTIYRVRVLGEFPRADDNTVIPLEWVDSSVDREVEQVPGKVIWGLDVARFGDDKSALAKRKRNILLEPVISWGKADTMQTVGRVVREFNETPDKDKPDEIMVDSIGVGAGVVDRLKEQGLPARGVNVAERPSDHDKHLRLRDELWWKGREWFQGMDVVIPEDKELIAELITLTYKLSSAGKTQVESKDDAKKRGIASPNLADAFLLTFATSDNKSLRKPLVYPSLGIG
ncbi:MAG: terminase B [Candidatus Thiodiazotropha weberae]|nr:terminase B [Candidatus Thiodiazotropha weberae]